jgi:ATP-dependent Clp protease ATP-binding subunit ClpB
MEKHAVSRMIGAPPGYVGYDEGGQLTEAVRRKPYSVVLFDEIEKAHADVFNVLLQILDDGRVTDSHGRTVSFKNTVIIMTSNIGSPHLLGGVTGSGEIMEGARERVMSELRSHFRPEFLNRVDDVVVFKPLSREDLSHIVDLQVVHLKRLLGEKKIGLEITQAAEDLIADLGYDPVYGARPLKRVIQGKLQNHIAMELLEGQYAEGDRIRVDVKDGELAISKG